MKKKISLKMRLMSFAISLAMVFTLIPTGFSFAAEPNTDHVRLAYGEKNNLGTTVQGNAVAADPTIKVVQQNNNEVITEAVATIPNPTADTAISIDAAKGLGTTAGVALDGTEANYVITFNIDEAKAAGIYTERVEINGKVDGSAKKLLGAFDVQFTIAKGEITNLKYKVSNDGTNFIDGTNLTMVDDANDKNVLEVGFDANYTPATAVAKLYKTNDKNKTDIADTTNVQEIAVAANAAIDVSVANKVTVKFKNAYTAIYDGSEHYFFLVLNGVAANGADAINVKTNVFTVKKMTKATAPTATPATGSTIKDTDTVTLNFVETTEQLGNNAKILYTTNGDDPSIASNNPKTYAGPFVIPASDVSFGQAVVNAVVVSDKLAMSDVATFNYTVSNEATVQFEAMKTALTDKINEAKVLDGNTNAAHKGIETEAQVKAYLEGELNKVITAQQFTGWTVNVTFSDFTQVINESPLGSGADGAFAGKAIFTKNGVSKEITFADGVVTLIAYVDVNGADTIDAKVYTVENGNELAYFEGTLSDDVATAEGAAKAVYAQDEIFIKATVKAATDAIGDEYQKVTFALVKASPEVTLTAEADGRTAKLVAKKAGTHTVKATFVNPADGTKLEKYVTFAVSAKPTINIAGSEGTTLVNNNITFNTAVAGYATPQRAEVKVTGTDALEGVQVTATEAALANFDVSAVAPSSIPKDGAGYFSITPKLGLPKGTYAGSAKVTAKGAFNEQTINFTFVVADPYSDIIIEKKNEVTNDWEAITTYDFGEIAKTGGADFEELHLKIRNNGNTAVKFNRMNGSDNFATLTVDGQDVKKGLNESLDIVVAPGVDGIEFALKPDKTLAAGTYNDTFTMQIHNQELIFTTTFKVANTVKKAISIDTPNVEIGSVENAAIAAGADFANANAYAKEIVITNTGNDNVILNANLKTDFDALFTGNEKFVIHAETGHTLGTTAVAPGKKVKLKIEPVVTQLIADESKLPVAASFNDFDIKDSAGTILGRISGSYTVDIAKTAIEASIDEVNFGTNVSFDGTINANVMPEAIQVKVKNIGNSAITAANLTATMSGVNTNAIVLDKTVAGGDVAVRKEEVFTLTPQSNAPIFNNNGKIEFKLTDGTNVIQTIEIPVKWNVEAPRYTMSADSMINLEPLPVGYTANDIVPGVATVTNTGNTEFAIQKVEYDNTLVAVKPVTPDTLGQQIAVGGTATFEIAPVVGLAQGLYTVPVTIINAQNIQSVVNVNFRVGETTLPGEPTGIYAKSNDINSIRVAWDPVPGAEVYLIQVKDNGGTWRYATWIRNTKMANGKNYENVTSFVNAEGVRENFVLGQTYEFRVAAGLVLNGVRTFNEEAFSRIVSAPLAPRAPSNPEAFTVPGNKKNLVTWSTMPGADCYLIQYRVGGKGAWQYGAWKSKVGTFEHTINNAKNIEYRILSGVTINGQRTYFNSSARVMPKPL